MNSAIQAERKTMMVAGATGIVGSAVIDYFTALPDWNVVAISRRPVAAGHRLRHIPADLTDAGACKRAVKAAGNVTHLMYTALYEKPDLVAGWREQDQMDVNGTMLKNLLDALETDAPRLRQVTVMQGTKAYGLHSTQVPVPAKERWARAQHEVFYWQQEDLLRERQPDSAWTYTILRPQLILGNAVGSPMNVIGAIGVYAAVMRELGRPLSFPGGGRYVHAASDSRLIAKVAHFAATHDAAANETYNVVNGDMLVWQDIWPSIAAHFGMELGEPTPLRLAQEMPRYEAVWQALAKKRRLNQMPLTALLGSSWQFTDRTFGYGLEAPLDRIMSPIKLYQAGFEGCVDTEDALLYWLGRMQEARLLPD